MDERIRARLGLPSPDPGKPLRDLRVFGFGLAVIAAVLSALAWRKGLARAPWELALAVALALLAGLWPRALKPLYRPWMKAVGAIGKANKWLIMALTYYLIVTPYAVLLRLFGHPLLDLQRGRRASYWRPREAAPEPGSYRDQF